MKSETWALLGAVVFLIAVGVFSTLGIQSCNTPKPLPLPRIVHDTTRTPYPVYIKGETHYIKTIQIDTVYPGKAPKYSYFDALSIDTLGFKGNVSATVTPDSLGAKWDWSQWLQLPPKVTIIDSIYVPQIVLQNKPFLQDGWFYGTVGLFVLSARAD